eukprot:207779-Chlamydomonas_euryale.AAC.1
MEFDSSHHSLSYRYEHRSALLQTACICQIIRVSASCLHQCELPASVRSVRISASCLHQSGLSAPVRLSAKTLMNLRLEVVWGIQGYSTQRSRAQTVYRRYPELIPLAFMDVPVHSAS